MSPADPLTRETPVGQEAHRIFLVVVDETEELSAAIRYACNRARRTGGRVALMCAYDTDKELGTFAFVGNAIDNDARAAADTAVARHAAVVRAITRREPEVFIRKGNRREELFKLVAEHPEINMLVLAAAPGARPGPLVEAVTGKYAGKISTPVTIVPGDLTEADIDRLTSG